MRFTQARFRVTAGAVIVNEQSHVLLLKHVFRPGSGWGIPGGFLEKGEQPHDAIRRELREETGMELDSIELAFIRTLERTGQVEIIYRARARGEAAADNYEIKSAEWFPLDRLPSDLSRDQRQLINRTLNKNNDEGRMAQW